MIKFKNKKGDMEYIVNPKCIVGLVSRQYSDETCYWVQIANMGDAVYYNESINIDKETFDDIWKQLN